ncbi:MAG: SMC-Scp complex subunit ScpB, partial [Chloroflexota bacterium]
MADQAELRMALESLLFVAGRPVELTELRRVLDVPREALEDLLTMLAGEYAERGMRIARLKD